jgi:hypothetical protein
MEPFPAARRSQRLSRGLPVIVCGKTIKRQPFREEALTVELSAHGALLLLYENVASGQNIRLLNPTTWDEQDACVVHSTPFHNGLKFVGIKFMLPAPAFWPVMPPNGWNLAPIETRDPAGKGTV